MYIYIYAYVCIVSIACVYLLIRLTNVHYLYCGVDGQMLQMHWSDLFAAVLLSSRHSAVVPAHLGVFPFSFSLLVRFITVFVCASLRLCFVSLYAHLFVV